MGRIFIFLLCVIFHPVVQANIFNKISDKLSDLVFNNETTVKVPLIELNDDDNNDLWLRPSIGYEFQFMNYPEDPTKYLRRESLTLRLGIPKNLNGHIGVALGPSIESQFIRPFSKGDLVKVGKDFVSDARPYSPSKAPHNHEKALDLKPGDYYSFQSTMAFQIGASTANLNGFAFLGLGVRYVVSGDFKVDVYRLKGTKVKVVASNLRQRSLGVNAGFRIIPDIEVFGISAADSIINDQIQVQVFDWNFYEKTKGQLFSVSYTYDLSTQDGIFAYNYLVNSGNWKRPKFKVFKPHSGPDSKIREFWMADFSASSRYAETGTGVVHNDESQMDYLKTSAGIRFDIKILGQNIQRNFMEIDYQVRKDPTAPFDHYRIASLTINQDHSEFFKFNESKITREATAIFAVDEKSNITSFDEITLSFKRSDIKLTLGEGLDNNEVPAIYGQLHRMLPESLHFWEKELKKKMEPLIKEGSFVSMEINFDPLALKVLESITRQEIDNVVDDTISRIKLKLRSKSKEDHLYYGVLEIRDAIVQAKINSGSMDTVFSQTKINRIKESLAFVLEPTYGDTALIEAKWAVFKQLQSNILFRDFGSAFIVRLLDFAAQKNPDIGIYDLLVFRIKHKSDSKEESHITFGNYVRPEYTKALLRDRDRVLNRQYNPAHFIEPEEGPAEETF